MDDFALLEAARRHPSFYGDVQYRTEAGQTKVAEVRLTLKTPFPPIWQQILRALADER